MLVRGVAGNQIQTDLNSFGMCILNESYQIRVRAETRVYLIVVGDVIATVLEPLQNTGLIQIVLNPRSWT